MNQFLNLMINFSFGKSKEIKYKLCKLMKSIVTHMIANYFQGQILDLKRYSLMNFYQEIDTHFYMKIQ